MLKKILLISIHGDPLASLGSIQAGGQNNYVKQLMYSLSERGYNVDVLTHWSNHEDSPVEVLNEKLRMIRISAKRLKYIPKDSMYDILSDFYQEVKNRINLADYDILHTNYWLSGILGYVIKTDYGLPWVHTSHSLGRVKARATGKLNKLRVRAENVIFTNVDTIIATTEDEKKVITTNYEVDGKIKVIPIGVDPIFFMPTFTNPIKEKYFIYVGRLEKNKGIETLIEAFKLMQANYPNNAKLVVVGGGCKANVEFKIPIKIKENMQEIKDKIIFAGGLPQSELVNILSNAIATIVPSYYESFGMVAAESQAAGVPVIATNVGGLKEVVKNETTGYLFVKKDALTLASLMAKIYNNNYVRTKLGRQAKKFARCNFDWDKVTDQITSQYKELMDEKEEVYISN